MFILCGFVYSICLGGIFIDNILSEEELLEWQQYWKKLLFIGIVEKKYNELQIANVEKEQKEAVVRLEENRIK